MNQYAGGHHLKSWFRLDPRSGVPMYLQLKEQIKMAVAGGVLKMGDRLPPVRELAAELNVNPNTIARAYSELEKEGLLRLEQGRGTFINGKEPLLGIEERSKKMRNLIDKLLMEAYHLHISYEQLDKLWQERLNAWEKRLNQREEGEIKKWNGR